jgi:glycosyltransferase involved in cell wall biosynthesis
LKISLILPVYNPVDGWADTVVEKCKEVMAIDPTIQYEVVIVNDGSTNAAYQKDRERLERSSFRLIEYSPNQGKGEALRTGVQAASGDLIIYTDIDFPYTLDSLTGIIDTLQQEHKNVVIGIKDASYYEHVPPFRRFISKLFRSFIRLLFRIPTDDTQCGLKGFDQRGKEIFLKTTIKRYLFDLEFVFLSSQDSNISIKTQEIKLRADVQFRKMNFGIIKSEVWNFLKILARSYLGISQ